MPSLLQELVPTFRAPCVLPRELGRAPDPLRSKPAGGAEEPVGQRPLRASFCDAVSDRASIFACIAFNTEARAASNEWRLVAVGSFDFAQGRLSLRDR